MTARPEEEQPERGSRAAVTGSASDMVQAGAVHGGVHFHGAGDRAPRRIPRQLPSDVSGFVNRSAELNSLGEARGLYVITGTAGVGKTSLALRWAHRARHRFPDGQLYVNLRGYDPGIPMPPELALDRFLRALGVPPEGLPLELEDKSALYRSLLADQHVLIVLDNAFSPRQVRPLLPGNPDCLVLVTTRSRFSGLFALQGAHRLALDTLAEGEAVNLLRTVMADYRSPDDPAELLELARLCARLPLALRIAAERASSRPLMLLSELIADLRDESGLWEALTAEEGEESDAVRTVFAWSYRALPEEAARMFRLLGLHPGAEFSRSAAAALAGVSSTEARRLLDVLIGAHVLEQRSPDRYEFHDLLRAFAIDQANQEESGQDRQDALARVLSWYVRSARAAIAVICPLDRDVLLDPLTTGITPMVFADQDTAFRFYEQERGNFVAATNVAARAGFYRLAWQLPAVLWSVYALQNPFLDWISTGEVGLAAARQAEDPFGEAQLLASLGMAFLQSHQLDRAEEFHRGALTVRERIDDRLGIAMSVNDLGILANRRHQLVAARGHFGAALVIFHELGDRSNEAWLLSNLGMVDSDLDRHSEAVPTLHAAALLAKDVGDPFAEANALCSLAIALRRSGQQAEAGKYAATALELSRANEFVAGEAVCVAEQGWLALADGRPDAALSLFQHATAIQRRLGDRSREAQALDATGVAYRRLERAEEAVHFHRTAIVIQRQLDDRWELALALNNLATVLDPDAAREYWTEAARLLDEFDDPRAVRIRAEVADRLAES
jgi:tetratricopeptide (TPR) repeat protein